MSSVVSRVASRSWKISQAFFRPPLRTATTTSAGEVLPMPHVTRFGLIGIFCTVVPGLLIGATISKKMANFLEENELFVPSDDDDDDD
ncbi:essential MCU regulator, mitochondrial-like [Cimex lectularius]|uniref:Essential MCU regulator, mitochondrial n=1 Tax=Cimex lectularius TaxID=79782 RepID=A0A8I6SKN1_CIMLE|nr:essential MCU regulator, mitochondrial-like [Cimex lectularius]